MIEIVVAIIIWSLVIALFIAGLVATLMNFPGVWLIFVGIFISALYNGFNDISIMAVLIFALMALLISLIDNLIIREVSTLSSWGMNGLATEFDVKSMDINKLLIEAKFFEELLNAKLEDIKLENIEQLKNKFDAELKLRQPKTVFDYL